MEALLCGMLGTGLIKDNNQGIMVLSRGQFVVPTSRVPHKNPIFLHKLQASHH